ncbi:O-antigen ligase family protein [Paraperlucidibaca baekdonensis]|nr:O-antigen ligase family protein [Paraperlucidibaca baekdonensis]
MTNSATNEQAKHNTVASASLLLAVVALIFSPVARSPSVWVLLGMTLLVLWQWRPAFIAQARALRPIALPLLAGLIISLALSAYPWQGGTVFRDIIKALLVAITVAVVAQHAQWHWLKQGIATLCGLFAAMALVLYNAPALHASAVHWLNSIENMNLWGSAFALLLSISLAVACCSRPIVAAGIVLAVVINFAWLSLYYPSRGALLAVLCVAGLLVLLRYTRLPLSWLFGLTVAAFFIGSLAVFILQAGDWMSDAKINAISSNRLPIYDTIWHLWQQAPWFGWGLKAFKSHAAVDIAAVMRGAQFTAPHNVLLEMLYSLGIIGTILVLTSLGRITWQAFSAARSRTHALPGLVAAALLVTLLLHGTTDLSIYRPYFWLLVFSAWGLAQGWKKPI